MKMDGKRRFLASKIEKLLGQFPVVAILGARQCGKSTLSRQIRPQWHYYDLENPNHYERLHDDPVLFFRENPDNIVIDEIQKAPKIFEVLRGVIDKHRKRKGRFIITGSSSFELTKNISESLAGRVALVELNALKMDEFLEKGLSPFFEIFAGKITSKDLSKLKNLKSYKSLSTIKNFLLKGGYPEPVLSEDDDFWANWMDNYFKTYINQDMRSLFPRLDLVKYRRLIQMLSSVSGTIVNKSEIARSIETGEKNVRDYIDIVKGTFFWRELKAFQTSKIKTTSKLSKGHFRDSGLLLFLQNIYSYEDLQNYPRLGNVFESFIVEEVLRGVEATGAKNLDASHFRTKAGGEIDLILTGSFGTLPIEVKYASQTSKSQLKSMIHFIDLHDLPMGVVINNCEQPSFITEKIIQIPAGAI